MKANASYKLMSDSRTVKQQVGWNDYFVLTKPTITLLVVVTVIPSLFLASPTLPSSVTAVAAVFGAMLASASAAVFNQVVEMDLDGTMQRTRKRSLASGRLTKLQAVSFGLVLGFLSLFVLYRWTTPAAVAAALAGHLFYVVVYTLYLKKRTVQNIVIGGAAGAVGPLIGWAAVTGTIAWPAWVLFLIICLWTPPHFWALALKYKDDYAAAGVPMYPVVHGDERTRRVMLLYTLSLLPCVVALYTFDAAGLVYLIPSLGFTLKFIVDAWSIYLSHSNEKVMPFFHYSCFYTFGIFGALTLDSLVAILLTR